MVTTNQPRGCRPLISPLLWPPPLHYENKILVAAAITDQLQGTQEVQYLLLLGGAQVIEVLLYGVRLAAITFMCFDGRKQVRCAAIVQQEDSLSQPPQGSCAELVAARVALRNVVCQAGTHVMEFDIRKGVYLCVTQGWHEAGHLGGADRGIVAGRAPNRVKQGATEIGR